MSTRLAVALAVVASASACGDGDGNSVVIDTTDPVGETVDVGHANGDFIAAQASSELAADDYTTLLGKTAGILAEMNKGEISTASFAANIIIDDSLFAFANVLVDDFSAADIVLDDVVRSYGVPYIISDAQTQLSLENQAAMSLLRETPQDAFDFVFAGMQVEMLAEQQVILDELYGLVGPGAMGDYILSHHDMVDDHLDEAMDELGDFF
jgi:hypothetical protein